ncbi:MAG: UvrD-helicase domain-containing protein, partial [Phycisphaerae bacterium]|nr:UvrD-helicase domain-containing protein [Phycisphaerae bacterium]
DDLLMLTVRMLRECDEARNEVQARWKYLMIDEYQDTNHAQFELSAMLIGESAVGIDPISVEGLPGIEPAEIPVAGRAPHVTRNICVVGDPDQSIYGWRGADISNILDFEEQYPGARVIKLGQNFRSTAPILNAADTLIKHNRKRKDKPLFTVEKGGDPPEVVLCRDEHHEAQRVLEWMKGIKGASLSWKDFAVFYRNNALSRVMEDALRQAGVPYIIVRGTAFYQREEVKDAVAYLRVVANPADSVSLRRIVNKPARKIGSASFEKVEAYAERTNLTLLEAMRNVGEVGDLSPAAAGAVRKFVEMIDGWTGGGTFLGGEVPTSLADLVSRVISESGLEAHYRAAKTKGGDEDAQKFANLEEIVSSARDFEEEYDSASDAAMDAPRVGTDADAETPPLLSMLRAYLERVSLVADADAIDPASGAVTLMTLHAAKGLEFPAVAMIGLEEGLLPSMHALQDPSGDPEEERRLCFVGITRAMKRLLITCAKYRAIRGLRERTIPSRFLSELPKDGVTLRDESEAWEDFDMAPPAPGRGPGRGARGASDAPSNSNAGARASSGPLPQGRGSTSAPKDDPQYPVGSKVRHPQFGVGTVQSVTGLGVNRRATIAFLQTGVKTLILQYARLDRV